MSAIAGSILQYSIKAIIFAATAYAGIICGRKFRNKKDANQAAGSQEGR